jgi:hypothetical protein
MCYICIMNQHKVEIYTEGDILPDLSSDNFFHSPEFFHIVEHTPGQRPYMAIAFDGQGRIMGHLLAVISRRGSLIPPYLYTWARIYGEGEYADGVDSETVFGALLSALTHKFRNRLCFFAEMSNLSKKMFAYRFFRSNGYFPVNWQEVHNSLHSMPPMDRLSPKTAELVKKLLNHGVSYRPAKTEREVNLFYKILRQYYRFRFRRYIPPLDQVLALFKSDNVKILLTVYKERIIGGSICVYTGGNAYLWYMASRRKRYRLLHPEVMTVWGAIDWAWHHNYAHIRFLDVGLPYHGNPYRRFILKFGGKPVAKYRWFRFFLPWVNKPLRWMFRE